MASLKATRLHDTSPSDRDKVGTIAPEKLWGEIRGEFSTSIRVCGDRIH